MIEMLWFQHTTSLSMILSAVPYSISFLIPAVLCQPSPFSAFELAMLFIQHVPETHARGALKQCRMDRLSVPFAAGLIVYDSRSDQRNLGHADAMIT